MVYIIKDFHFMIFENKRLLVLDLLNMTVVQSIDLESQAARLSIGSPNFVDIQVVALPYITPHTIDLNRKYSSIAVQRRVFSDKDDNVEIIGAEDMSMLVSKDDLTLCQKHPAVERHRYNLSKFTSITLKMNSSTGHMQIYTDPAFTQRSPLDGYACFEDCL